MRTLLIVLTTVGALLGATGAALASGKDVLDDCTDDEVMSKTYAQKEYRAALSELSADTDQYGNCRDVIRRAQLAALAIKGKRAGGGASEGPRGGASKGPRGGAPQATSTPSARGAIGSPPADEQLSSATAGERRALSRARAQAVKPVRLDDATVDPAKVGAVPGGSQVSDLPTPLVALLALLLAGALALAGIRIRRLVDARRD
jgi:hypothetical protein